MLSQKLKAQISYANNHKLSEQLRCAMHTFINSILPRNKPYHEIWTSVSKVGCEWFWFFTNISWYLDSAYFSLKNPLQNDSIFSAHLYICNVSWITFFIFSSTKVKFDISYFLFFSSVQPTKSKIFIRWIFDIVFIFCNVSQI